MNENIEELCSNKIANKPDLYNTYNGLSILKTELLKAIKTMQKGKAACPEKISTKNDNIYIHSWY